MAIGERAKVINVGMAQANSPLIIGAKKTTTTVGSTTPVAIPTTNLSNRKGMYVTCNHDSANIFLACSIPDALKYPSDIEQQFDCTKKSLKWVASAGGTNEYYAQLPTVVGGNPSLTEPKLMYGYLTGSTIALLTNGTVGSLADHAWDWGDGDTLGYNTVYIADATGDPDASTSILLLSLTVVPADNDGLRINHTQSAYLDVDSSVIVLCLSDTAHTPVTTFEVR